MINVYKGNEPFIFISYSHKDTDLVLPYLEALSEKGYRLWYDNGIEAGTEWPEYIAERLMGSGTVIAFMSKNAQDSHNCRREINFAIELKKELLIVYLEDFPLTPGMRLQLGSLQALFSYNAADKQIFYNNLCNAAILAPCLNTPEPEVKAVPSDESNGATKAMPANEFSTDTKEESSDAPAQKNDDCIIISADDSKKLPEEAVLVNETKDAARREALCYAIYICNKSLKANKHPFEFKPTTELSEKQITNAIQKHKDIISENDILFIFDNSLFTTGKSGFIITENLFISNQSLFRYTIDLREIVGYAPSGKNEIDIIFANNKTKTFYFSIYREAFIDFFEAYFSSLKAL